MFQVYIWFFYLQTNASETTQGSNDEKIPTNPRGTGNIKVLLKYINFLLEAGLKYIDQLLLASWIFFSEINSWIEVLL